MGKEDPVFRSIELIERRIREKLTVENIASAVYFSKYHYQRLFREIMGDSVMEYVTKRKMTLAGRALLESDASIIDIALDFGFDSREGFTRSFKAYMGVSPNEYRKHGPAEISRNLSIKERQYIMYSKTTEEIIKELNDFIAEARSLSESARSIDLRWYKEFWASVADDTDAYVNRVKTVLTRVTSISEHPDEITNRFAILKAIEDIAFESNVLALNVGLTAIGRANPEDISVNKPVAIGYRDLARTAVEKAGKTAGFLHELATLIIDDMRSNAEQKIKAALQKGRIATDSVPAFSTYIKNELLYMVGDLEKTPVDEVTVSSLDECIFRLKIIAQSAKVDALRHPSAKPMRSAIEDFADSLTDAADFCRTSIKPDCNPPAESSLTKHFMDIAYQGNVLLFFTRSEVEKMGGLLETGGLLSDNQKAAFKKIEAKVNEYIGFAHNATDESAYKELAEKIIDVADDMKTEAEALGNHGGAIMMLADEFRGLGNAAMRCVK